MNAQASPHKKGYTMFSQAQVERFAARWFDALNKHLPVEQLLPMISAGELEMAFPERTLRSHADFREWYAAVGENVRDQDHIVERLVAREEGDNTGVDVTVVWKATQTADGKRIAVRASQKWLLARSEASDEPVVLGYHVLGFEDLAEKQHALEPREAIEKYYEYVNSNNWAAWCDLFAEDCVLDEQLAGRIEGAATLRAGLSEGIKGYSRFQNVLKHVIVNGNEGAAVTQISAANMAGVPIECGVMNYFRFDADGKIAYLANFHDSAPFKPFLEQ
jgi:hypothetical protein